MAALHKKSQWMLDMPHAALECLQYHLQAVTSIWGQSGQQYKDNNGA